jgi:MYXO-CTERM domain-containing protein
VYGIAVDSAGAAYVVGTTASPNFPTVGAIQPTLDGGADAFAAKLSPSGNALVYSTYLGGANPDVANAVAVDPAGNAYVAGQTASPNFPVTASALQATLDGGNDAFVAKLNASGAALTYSTFIGGGFDDFAYGVAADSAGNAYVTGNTDSKNFPATADAFQPGLAASFDAFFLQVSADGSQLGYSTYLGGVGFDVGQGIAFVPPGKVYLGGSTASFNFPSTGSAAVPANPGGNDAFVVQFDMNASADSGSTVDSGNPTPDGGTPPDSGSPPDAGSDAGTGSSSCGCQSSPPLGLGALVLALLLAAGSRRAFNKRSA